MSIETALFFGIMTFAAVVFLLVKLPLWAALPVVRHPVITDIVFTLFLTGWVVAMPSVAVIAVSIVAAVTVSIMLWANTKTRMMEKLLRNKVDKLITECKVQMADATNQHQYDEAMLLMHQLQHTRHGLDLAIKEIRV